LSTSVDFSKYLTFCILQDVCADREQRPGDSPWEPGGVEPGTADRGEGPGLLLHVSTAAVLYTHIHGEYLTSLVMVGLL